MNKALIALSVVMGMSSFAHAETPAPTTNGDQGHGTVTFTGSIIDAPCSITPDSLDQKVSLGSIANKSLENGGTSTPVPFQIKLEKCSIPTAKTVTTTFSGSEGKNGMLAITGNAAGAGIVLKYGDSKVELGKPTASQQIAANANAATLEFSAYLQGDGASIVPGDFSSVADFMLTYQ